MTHNNYVCLDYQNLVTEYEDRLVSMERGFSMDQEFIDLWVPDEDHNRSLFYLFEAAAMRNQKGLSVKLSAQIVNSIDGEGLRQSLQKLGTVEVVRQTSETYLTVSFERKGGNITSLDDVKGLSTLPRCYRDKLIKETRTLPHELNGQLDLKSISREGLIPLKTLEVPFKSGRVLFAFELKTGIIHAMRYSGLSKDELDTRMLELLCRISVGYSLQELAEHGIIRLENFLRNPSLPPPVRGLITPDNAGFAFSCLNNFCCNVFKKAMNQFQLNIDRNTTEASISQEWLNLTEKQQLEKINPLVHQYLTEKNLPHITPYLLGIRQDIQFFIDFDGICLERERRMIIKDLEKLLKAKVEPRLEVYLPTAEDKLKRDIRSGTLVKKEYAMSKSKAAEKGAIA